MAKSKKPFFHQNKRFKRSSSEKQVSSTPAAPIAKSKMTPENLELDFPPYSKVTHEQWLKLLYLRVRNDCPDTACMIKDINPIKPSKPHVPTNEEAENKAIISRYNIDYKAYNEEKRDLKNQKKKLSGHTWRCVSDSIREYINSKDPDAEPTHNVTALLHYSQEAYFASEHSTPAGQKQAAEDDFYNCMQLPTETVPVFYNRYKDLIIDCEKKRNGS